MIHIKKLLGNRVVQNKIEKGKFRWTYGFKGSADYEGEKPSGGLLHPAGTALTAFMFLANDSIDLNKIAKD